MGARLRVMSADAEVWIASRGYGMTASSVVGRSSGSSGSCRKEDRVAVSGG